MTHLNAELWNIHQLCVLRVLNAEEANLVRKKEENLLRQKRHNIISRKPKDIMSQQR